MITKSCLVGQLVVNRKVTLLRKCNISLYIINVVTLLTHTQ